MDRLNLGKLFGAFVKLRPRLEAGAQWRTGSRATAEDLIQDTWLKLEGSRFESSVENPAGFITQVAKSTIAGHLRKEGRRAEIDAEVSELLWDSVDVVSPERMLIGRESLKAVQAALDELPEKTRRIFLMNRIDRIPHRKIAEIYEMTDDAVYYHIRRALERLADIRNDLAD